MIEVSEKERYAQIKNICDTKLEEMVNGLREQYSGFMLDISYVNQKPPVQILDRLGAKLLEDTIELRLTKSNFAPSISEQATSIKPEVWEEFAKIYDERNPGFFWNSKRLEANKDRWSIFVNKGLDGKISGGITLKDNHEIFAIWAENSSDLYSLISCASKCALDNGAYDVLKMSNRENMQEQAALKRVGFTETGYYIGYRINSL